MTLAYGYDPDNNTLVPGVLPATVPDLKLPIVRVVHRKIPSKVLGRSKYLVAIFTTDFKFFVEKYCTVLQDRSTWPHLFRKVDNELASLLSGGPVDVPICIVDFSPR